MLLYICDDNQPIKLKKYIYLEANAFYILKARNFNIKPYAKYKSKKHLIIIFNIYTLASDS